MKDLPLPTNATHLVTVTFEPGDGGWWTYDLMRRRDAQVWLVDAYRSAEHLDWGWTCHKKPIEWVQGEDHMEVQAYIVLPEAEYILHLFAAQSDKNYRPWTRRKNGTIQHWDWFPEDPRCQTGNPL